ncbi:MAG: choice-of-anchor D domain-containing protein [Gammaproteobacteria bacterium]|nr:choice-of-anchor D domain-containing protein [Gammaproteobacteria bacterium]
MNGLTTNNATLSAQNGGTLQLSSAVTNAGSGHIDATGAGSSVVQNGVTITGGTINTTGGGVLAPTNNGNNFLNGVTVNGTIDLATATAIERIGGGTTINTGGAFNINNNSILSFQGTQSIGTTGIGNIVLGNTGSSNRIAIEGGTTLTVDPGVIIHGQNGTIGSQIFAGGAADLINNGTIATDVNGGLITIAPNGNLTNSGTLRAANGGTLTVSPAVAFTNLSGTTLTGGAYEVIAGGGTSNLRLPNANIVTNAATILLDGANSNLLNNNTSGDALASLATNATTTTPGNFTIQNGRNFTTASAFINNALGVVTVGNSSTFNSTGAFTNSGTLAMRGGTFDAPASLINSGVVNGSGIVNPNIQNTGTVQAFGGTLTATNGITGAAGAVQSDAGGALAIGAASTAGTLTNNGNLALGTNNITVSNAYNNANFGSGNSFNNRANVTGAGQILAAGLSPSTAQTLSGNIVPTPTSGNATMNFGNIHVGSSSTLNYQIGNANTGGPDLLGAIQTTVNGGNITDARLSGAGVTASNWGPVAAGGNTGNLGVTFSAASGGALTGQQVHIRNNFDNTNAQNLTITGAAYNLAAGNTTPSPVVFGNAHVGDVLTQGLTVSNTAPAGAFTEGLNASFGSNTGNAGNNAGSVSLLAGGASNNTNLSATLDTTAAGARSGTVTVNYVSDGAGASGLGTTSVGSQTINVSGNVYRLAQANSIAPINFGNVLVGSSQTQTVSISNLATADGFSEALNAAFGAIGGANPGQFSAAGFINQLAAGANNNANMIVTLNTSSAGAYSANVQILLNSDGTGTSGLGIAALPTQVINLDGLVTGTVGNLAQAGPHSPEPVNFGNVRVGTVVPTQALSISNTASGPAEGLNGSISTGSAGLTAAGSFTGLAAGATDNSSLLVGINTTTAGSRNGTATIALASDGTFNNGTQTTLSSQTVNVTGGVFQVAQPTVPANVNLGNVRIGGSPTQAITIGNTNISPAGFQEGLNASVGGASGGATGTGSITNLAAGSTSNAINVGLNVGGAGAQSGVVTLNLASNGTVSGLSDLALANANVNVQATGYRLADPVINTGSITLAARVGDASPSAGISVTNTSPDSFTEGLNVTRGSTTPADFTSSGSISNLAAGATDSSAIQVALNTSTAGTFTGTQGLNFVSTGAGTTGAADISVGTGNVNLNGKVYTPAQASAGTTSINFGIVHVGDVVAAQTVSLANSAPATALNDTLSGSLGGASAPFSASGSVSGLTAGGPADTTSLQVGLSTSTAGIFTDNGILMLASQNPDMPDLALADVSIDLNAQVNNYADAALRKNSGGGSFTGGGNLFVLDFGTVVFGSGAIASILEAFNSAFGPADLLDGIFSFLDTQDFTYSGFGSFSNLAAGQGNGGMSVGFNPTALGSFSDDIQLASLGHNASGYSDALQDIQLRVQGNVVAGSPGTVPEPGTWALLALGCFMLTLMRMRRGVR